MPYKALIFDFFGVVCSEISPFWFEEHLTEKGKALAGQYDRAANVGVIPQEELVRQLSLMAGVTPADIEKDWEAHAHFNTELIAFIRELRADGHKIGLLSNATSPFFHTVMALSGTVDLFDHVVVSSEVGHAKPDPEIYKIMLERMALAPSETIMIDDSSANIAGAASVGIPGHLYTSVQELRDFLSK